MKTDPSLPTRIAVEKEEKKRLHDKPINTPSKPVTVVTKLKTAANTTSTTSLKSPFRSPLAGPSSTSGGSGGGNTIALSLELKRLEGQAVNLRTALKTHRANQKGGNESDDRLRELAAKWKEAGKTAAGLLWDLSGSSSLDGGAGRDLMDSTNGYGASTSGFQSNWGWATTTEENDRSRGGVSWGWDAVETDDQQGREQNEEEDEKRDEDEDEELPTVEDALKDVKVKRYTLQKASEVQDGDGTGSGEEQERVLNAEELNLKELNLIV